MILMMKLLLTGAVVATIILLPITLLAARLFKAPPPSLRSLAPTPFESTTDSYTAEKVQRESAPRISRSTLTRDARAHLVELGRKRYEALRAEVEPTHRGRYIAISVKTGRFTTSQDDAELKAFAASLRSDDFLWMARVGLT